MTIKLARRRMIGVGAAVLALPAGGALAQDQVPDAASSPSRLLTTYELQQQKVNAWTVGLAAGLIEGAPLRLAAEMGRVVDDGANLQVLPIVTRGPTANLNALLFLKGVDLAIINADALEEYRIQVPEIKKHVVHLLELFPSELHVFVRPEISSLADLEGKKVNFNTLGTTAAYSGPMIFSRLGIGIDKTFIPHPVALQHMRRGDIAAVVFVTSKPVEAFLRGKWEGEFKFLPVPYDQRFEDYYLPATLEASEYPALIAAGQRVNTLSVPTSLVSYNWPAGSDRFKRVARFTERLFERIGQLQGPGFDAKWKSVNLAATSPALSRFTPAEEWVRRHGTRLQASQ
jgi:TRAP-type uncharacterized transport system substrate-binding protein